MIIGNNECVLIGGSQYLRMGYFLPKIVENLKLKGINPIYINDMISHVSDSYYEAAEQIYENMLKEIDKSITMTGLDRT